MRLKNQVIQQQKKEATTWGVPLLALPSPRICSAAVLRASRRAPCAPCIHMCVRKHPLPLEGQHERRGAAQTGVTAAPRRAPRRTRRRPRRRPRWTRCAGGRTRRTPPSSRGARAERQARRFAVVLGHSWSFRSGGIAAIRKRREDVVILLRRRVSRTTVAARLEARARREQRRGRRAARQRPRERHDERAWRRRSVFCVGFRRAVARGRGRMARHRPPGSAGARRAGARDTAATERGATSCLGATVGAGR